MTFSLNEKYLLDSKGRPKAVQIPIRDYRRLLDLLEDLADIRVAKKRLREKSIPFSKVTRLLKRD